MSDWNKVSWKSSLESDSQFISFTQQPEREREREESQGLETALILILPSLSPLLNIPSTALSLEDQRLHSLGKELLQTKPSRKINRRRDGWTSKDRRPVEL